MITLASNPAQLLSARLSAKPVPGEQFLRVSMIGDNAAVMSLIVNTLLEAYLRQREDKQRAWDEQILSSLRAEQVALETRLKAKDLELRQLAHQDGIGSLDDSGSALQDWIVELRQSALLPVKKWPAFGGPFLYRGGLVLEPARPSTNVSSFSPY